MKKYIAFSLTLILIATLFSSCSVFKGEAEKDTSTTNESSTTEPTLAPEDMPTILDEDGNVVDYTVTTEENEETNEDGVQNPYLSIGSLDDINKQAGTNIKKPSGIKVTNEEFDVNESYSPKIACYTFMVNYKDYTIWASKKTGPMLMGIYLDDGTRLGEDFTGTETISPKEYNGVFIARWFNDGVQYNLFAEDVTMEEFKTVYNAVK